jgi:hypothetical protein
MSRRTKPGATVAAGAVVAVLWWTGVGHAQDLALSVDIPKQQVADWPFDVTAAWRTDAPRVLTVVLIRATSCGENLSAGVELDPAGQVVIEETVSHTGSRTDDVTLVPLGSYLGCAYPHSSSDPAAPADLVAQRGGSPDAGVAHPSAMSWGRTDAGRGDGRSGAPHPGSGR